MTISITTPPIGPEPRRERRKTRTPTARDLVIQARNELPRGSIAERFRRFEELLDLHPYCQSEVDEHYHRNIERDLDRSATKADHDAERASHAAESDDIVGREAKRLQDEIVLLALTMPNGKIMAQCTGAEMHMFGKAYQHIAKEVGPKRLVGDVLDEENVRRLMKL